MSTGLVTKNFRNLGKCAKNLDMPNAAPLCETNQEQYLKGNERRRTPQSAAQTVAKVDKAFRAKPEFNINLKNPGTCATDFSPIDSRVSKSGAFWHEARAHESVSVS